MYVAFKVLEQHLDPTSAAANPGSAAARSSAVLGSASPFARGSASGSVAVSAAASLQPPSINGPLPEFNLPRSLSADLPNNLKFFRSTLPQPSDEVLAYPSSRKTPRRECILKVISDCC